MMRSFLAFPLVLCLSACGGGSGGSTGSADSGMTTTPLQHMPAPLPPPAPDPISGPVLLSQPASPSVALGTGATFSIAANGTGTLSYQWTFNGIAIPGASGASYTIPAVTAYDSANEYRVKVTDARGSVTSAPTTVRIASPGAWLFAGQVKSDNVFGDSAERYSDGFGARARFAYPQGLAIDGYANLWVADFGNGAVRKVSYAGDVSTKDRDLSGFAAPRVIAASTDGTAYFSQDNSARVVTLSPDGTKTELVLPMDADATPALHSITAMVVDWRGIYYDVLYSLRQVGACSTPSSCQEEVRQTLRVRTPDGVTRTQILNFGAQFTVDGMAVDPAGNVYLSDRWNSVVRKLAPDGSWTIVAGQFGESGTTDGTLATARLAYPTALGVDGKGNVYILMGGAAERIIRKLSPDGMLSTVFTESAPGWQNLPTPRESDANPGFAVTPGGILYLTHGNAILRIVPN